MHDPLIQAALDEARENPLRFLAEGAVLLLLTLTMLGAVIVLWAVQS